MSRWHGGKGSTRRPEDKLAYDNGWDRIFNKSEEYTPSNKDVLEHIKDANKCTECGLDNKQHKMDCSKQ